MGRRTASATGLTAVELVAASLFLIIILSLGTWMLGNRDRRKLTSLATFSPGHVFEMTCEYVDEPSRSLSIVCTVFNPTRYNLPLKFRPNSFFERRESLTFAGLPITAYPDHEVDEDGLYVSVVPAGRSIKFLLFSEFPLDRSARDVFITPSDHPLTIAVSAMPPANPSPPLKTELIRPDKREEARVHLDDRAILYTFPDNETAEE